VPPGPPDQDLVAPLSQRCPDCGGEVCHDRDEEQRQVEIPDPKVVTTRFKVAVGDCVDCDRRLQGRHRDQVSDALSAAGVQIGPNAKAFGAWLRSRTLRVVQPPHASTSPACRVIAGQPDSQFVGLILLFRLLNWPSSRSVWHIENATEAVSSLAECRHHCFGVEAILIDMASRVSPMGQMVIPKTVRDELGIPPGDEVDFTPDGSAVYVECVRAR